MTMNMDHDSFDWAHDAFVALNANSSELSSDHVASDKWAAYTNMQPNLAIQASIERHGQITPPEDLSPAQPRRDSVVPQQPAPPTQVGGLPWPTEHQHQALHDFHPQQAQSRSQAPPERVAKRRHTAKPANASQSQSPHKAVQPRHTAGADPQPPKRKRGRPKSVPQPQSIEEYSKDGLLFPLSNTRQSHLEKNRVAAHKCRQRRKEYIDSLEARGREASHKNKALKESVALLREEILELKNEVLRHAGCNFWAVDEYLARCAGDLLGMDGPPPNNRQKEDPTPSLPHKTEDEVNIKQYRELSADSSGDFDNFFGNFDEEMEGVDA